MALIGQAVSEEMAFEIVDGRTTTGSGEGDCLRFLPYMGRGRQPLGSIFFINSIIQSIKSFAARFPPLNDFVTVFHNQTYR